MPGQGGSGDANCLTLRILAQLWIGVWAAAALRDRVADETALKQVLRQSNELGRVRVPAGACGILVSEVEPGPRGGPVINAPRLRKRNCRGEKKLGPSHDLCSTA
jgi:NADPH-dependent 2,4-dienoyl-CoA reductase/sulfur reductase-like enzyme